MPEEPKNETTLPVDQPNDSTPTPIDNPFEQPSQPVNNVFGSGPDPSLTAPVVAVAKPKKFKGPLFIGAVVAAALIVFGGGSALAYNLWYQNPDKVVSDAIVNAITAKTVSATGTFDVKTDDYTIKVAASAKNDMDADSSVAVKLTFESDDINYDVDGEGIISADGDLYVKLNDAKELADSIEEQSDDAVDLSIFDDIITKIDSKWIKIGKDDLGDFGEEYEKSQKCFADISKSLDTDAAFRKTVQSETYDLYKAHPFIVVGDKLGSRTINGQGSLGYVLTGDADAGDKFFTSFEDTALGKKLKDCNKEIAFDDIVDASDGDSDTKTEAEIWISRFGHTITEVNLKIEDDEAKGAFVLNPVFNKNDAVEIPTDTVPFSELQQDLETAYDEYYASYYDDSSYEAYDTPANDTDDSSALYN